MKDVNSVNHLVEFLPSIERRRAAGIKERNKNKEIQDKAHEDSIISKLASKQDLLYGKKSFFLMGEEGGNAIPQVRALSEFSYSVEVPRLSVIDAVGFSEMITVFRVEKKALK